MRFDPEVQHVLNRYRLELPRLPSLGRTGELLGRGAGSSLEFQEYREYRPGDDLRHLDWAAYGRSDALMVRLFREEISPQLQILIDASRSMAIAGSRKATVARQLAAMFALMSAGLGGTPQIRLLDGGRSSEALGVGELENLTSLKFDASSNPADVIADGSLPPGRRAIRIVISDFLFPHDAEQFVRLSASDVTALWLIQTLSGFEDDPASLGGRKLIDVETGEEMDVILDRNTIAAYKDRLAALQRELARQCRRFHATFVTVIADRGLEEICREGLCRAALLRPA